MLSTPSKASILAAPARVLCTCAKKRSSILTYAFANSYAGRYENSGATYERILRYPDGRERRIRYPVPTEDVQTLGGGDEWETRNASKAARASTKPTSTLASPNPMQAPEQDSSTTAPRPEEKTEEPSGTENSNSIPDSPLALLRFLTSDAHKESQRREQEELQNSYEILQGCPWPIPRPLYVLAARQPNIETGLTHTLRTRLPMNELEDEMTRLLGRTGPSGEPILRCSRLVDGIVTFQSEDEAEQYGQFIEDSGAAQGVAVVRCDSHELFRSVQSVNAAVILLKKDCKVPYPHQLAAAVKGPPSPLSSIDEEDMQN